MICANVVSPGHYTFGKCKLRPFFFTLNLLWPSISCYKCVKRLGAKYTVSTRENELLTCWNRIEKLCKYDFRNFCVYGTLSGSNAFWDNTCIFINSKKYIVQIVFQEDYVMPFQCDWWFAYFGMWHCIAGWVDLDVSKDILPSSSGSLALQSFEMLQMIHQTVQLLLSETWQQLELLLNGLQAQSRVSPLVGLLRWPSGQACWTENFKEN